MKTVTTQVIAKGLILFFFTFSLLSANNVIALSGTLVSAKVFALNHTTNGNGVIYTSLTASANDKTIVINWKTASEVGSDFFEVERSVDMQNFKTVALVLDGFAAEGTGKTYGFKEAAGLVKNGKAVYYRLKQIDKDGTVNYSPVMKVVANKQFALEAE